MAYLLEAGHIDKAEAYLLRHGDEKIVTDHSECVAQPIEPPKPTTLPCDKWQDRAWELVYTAQDSLWSDTGARALGWLHKRGLTDDTIRAGGLGYNPHDFHEDRKMWGLSEGKRMWLPRGVVIPWFIGEGLWRVNIRRPVKPREKPKCISLAGFANGLYEAERLKVNRPAILIEGELDALTILQEAGDLVAPVATGGTSGARRVLWLAKLALCSRVLVAFDADEAGEKARRWWLKTLQNGHYWRPFWGDANALLQDGADVRDWISSGLNAR